MSRQPLYRQAQVQLREYIVEHGLGPGDPLPPEAQLAERFGMSRLSLREAVKSLESLGVVGTQHGGGVFVSEFSFRPIIENLPYSWAITSADLGHMLELRESLEAGLAPRAVDAVADDDIDDLQSLVDRMREGPSDDELATLDRNFHISLFSPLGNPLVLQLIELFWEVFHRLHHEIQTSQLSGEEVAELHQPVVAALRERNAAALAHAITQHFTDINESVLSQSGGDTDEPTQPATKE